jgi:hypothetical protein
MFPMDSLKIFNALICQCRMNENEKAGYSLEEIKLVSPFLKVVKG